MKGFYVKNNKCNHRGFEAGVAKATCFSSSITFYKWCHPDSYRGNAFCLHPLVKD